MKTILQLKKLFIIPLLFLVGSVCNAQTTTINATLADPCSTLNVNDITKNIEFTIYPNPTSGLVNIQLNTSLVQNTTMKIYDLIGKLVFERNTFENNQNQNYSLNLNHLTSGIYLLSVQINDRTTTKKLIITK